VKFNFWEIVWAARVGVGLARVSWSWSCSGWLYHSSFPYAHSWYPHNSSSTSWRTNYQTILREQCENLKGDSHCPVVPLRTFFSIIEPYWIQNFRLLNPQFGPWNPRVWLIIYMLRTFKNHVSPYVPSFCKAKSLKKLMLMVKSCWITLEVLYVSKKCPGGKRCRTARLLDATLWSSFGAAAADGGAKGTRGAELRQGWWLAIAIGWL